MISSDLSYRSLLTCPFIFVITLIGGMLVGAAPVNGQVGKQVSNGYYSLAEAAAPVNLFISPQSTYLITQNGVYKQERKLFERKYLSASVITCALEEDSVIWLGTQKGLLRVSKKNFSSKPVALSRTENQPIITTLFKDYTGAVWVGAEAYGVFKLTAATLEKVLGAFPVNAGAVTRDSSVWIGTNTGLHRWKNNQWIRYNEEGVSNFEIPDNIVERLLVDNNYNLWVILSEDVTVFPAKPHTSGNDGHVPSVKFIGKPHNAIYSVIYVKQQGYVFATGMGLLFLPDNGNSDDLAGLESSSATDIVADKQLLHSVQLPSIGREASDFSSPVLLQSDSKNNIWFVNQRGIRVLTSKNFVKLLQTAKAKKESSPSANVLLK